MNTHARSAGHPPSSPASPENPSRNTSTAWTVEGFAAFWKRPDARRVSNVLTADVTGWWPGSAEPVRGIDAYVERIALLLELMPDLRLEVAEHATNGDLTFVRWIAYATLDGKPVSFGGVDCVRTRDGLVCENRIHTDHPALLALADKAAGRPATDSPH